MSLLFVGHPKETDLALFAGGELGPLARWRIERHLQGCEWCRETVADFFHLQGDLAELAELPSLDWDGIARQIRERLDDPAAVAEPVVAEAVPAEAPRRAAVRPVIWRLGFAMAAAVSVAVVIYQISTSPDYNPAEPVAELSQVMPERSTSELDGLRSTDESRDQHRDRLAREAPDESAANLQKGSDTGRTESRGVGAMLVAEGESRSDRDSLAGAEAASYLELKEEMVAAKERSLPGDTPRQMVPAEPPEVVGGARGTPGPPASNEPSQETLLTDSIAPAAPNERQFRRSLPSSGMSSPGMTVTGGLSIVPVSFGGDVEVGVAADGWLRFRTMDSTTGNITITHVYAQ